MKRLIALIITITLQFNLVQAKPKPLHNISDINKNFAPINERLYACKFETTNLDYRTFLDDVYTRTTPEAFKKLLPDSNKWRLKNSYNEPFVNYYFRHMAYNFYPVVNLSYEQANIYCAWLTKKYNEHPNRKFKKVVFRLPSKQEWNIAAFDTNKYYTFPWGPFYETRFYKNIVVNHVMISQGDITPIESTNDTSKIKFAKYVVGVNPLNNFHIYTSAVNRKNYIQNARGLYHISGNVSEMLKERGQTIGGNFKSLAYFSKLNAPDEFGGNFEPSPFIGFRVFMEIIEP